LTEATIMLVLGIAWTTWVALLTGALVTSFVLKSPSLCGRWRLRWRQYRLSDASREEDMPWNEFLVLLEQRNRERATAGLPPREATGKELEQLLVRLPMVTTPRPLELPEDREFGLVGGSERRTGNRRWGNPTEVHVRTSVADLGTADLKELLHASVAVEPLHGLVANRSTGGLGIYTDQEIPSGTFVTIRAVDAPAYVPSVYAEVRHSVKVGKGFVIGCQFTKDIPWNIRVWFG
jgi:PilZ domain